MDIEEVLSIFQYNGERELKTYKLNHPREVALPGHFDNLDRLFVFVAPESDC